jgi:CSLREA domain-containing protein
MTGTGGLRRIASAAIASLLLVSTALADVTFVVDSTLDEVDANPGDNKCETVTKNCTLRAAVMEANRYAGDTDLTITLPAGTYKLGAPAGTDGEDSGDLNLTAPLSIDSTIIMGSGSGNTIIDANFTDRVFDVALNRRVQIYGVTLIHGVQTFGGAIYNSGRLILDDVALVNNYASDSGGAIAVYDGIVAISHSALSDNHAGGSGGAIVALSGLSINYTTLAGNTAEGSGGGLYGSTTLDLNFVRFNDNAAKKGGGAIYNLHVLVFDHASLVGNSALYGGGIANKLTGSLTLTRSGISGNTAGISGGGGISNEGVMFMSNSTVSQNQTTGDGGGIDSFGTSNIYNSTIVFNHSGVSSDTDGIGGGINNAPPYTLNLRNSVVAGNTYLGFGLANDCFGSIGSYGRNRFSSFDSCAVTQVGTGNATTLYSIAELGPLRDNGGASRTHALLPLAGIDLVDAADPVFGCTDQNGALLDTDQRDRPRIAGAHCDIGAFEYDPGDIFINGFQ